MKKNKLYDLKKIPIEKWVSGEMGASRGVRGMKKLEEVEESQNYIRLNGVKFNYGESVDSIRENLDTLNSKISSGVIVVKWRYSNRDPVNKHVGVPYSLDADYLHIGMSTRENGSLSMVNNRLEIPLRCIREYRRIDL